MNNSGKRIQKERIMGKSRKTLISHLLLMLTTVTTAQTIEQPKSCEFKDAGLQFQSRLVREKGVLSGYEVRIRNTGAKDIQVFQYPELPYEAAEASIYEIPPDRSRRTKVSADVRLYPMHGPIESQQKWFRGPLRVGETKVVSVSLESSFRNGYLPRNDNLYDFRISFFFAAFPSDDSSSESANLFRKIRSEIGFSGCLSFSDVRLSEPSGR